MKKIFSLWVVFSLVFGAAPFQALAQVTDLDVVGDVVVQNSDVTLCKVDDKDAPLSGWTLKLWGNGSNDGKDHVGVTGQDGCVTFEDVVYGNYAIGEDLQLGWENVDGLGGVTVNHPTEKFTVVNKMEDEGGPDTVTVTIVKYIDETVDEHATTVNTNNASFPLTATWNATNIGAGSGSFALSGGNGYEATTSDMTTGASYSVVENLGTECGVDNQNQYVLVGYQIGSSVSAALASSVVASASLTNITSNKYIVVLNKKCGEIEGAHTLKVHILKYLDGEMATSVTANNYDFPMTATWQTANLNGGASTSGNYVLGNNHGGAADEYGADTSPMESPADYTTSEITDQTSNVLPVGAQCVEDKYRLLGYKSSPVSFADANANGVLSTSAPVFDNITDDQYVIVLNEKCGTTPPPVCDANAELIQNGSFENPTVTDQALWDIFPSGTSGLAWLVSWINPSGAPATANAEFQKNSLLGVTASDGTQWTELDSDFDGPNGSSSGEAGAVSLTQSVPTVNGQTYKVSFDFMPRPDVASSESKIEALHDATIGSTVDASAGSGWTNHSYTFIADDSSADIIFRDALGNANNSVGTLLDNVSVKCVPVVPPPVDVCTNIQGDQSSLPNGYKFASAGICVPTQCFDDIDNADPEDTLADEADPGCWTDVNDSNTYNPNDDDETNTPSQSCDATASGNVVSDTTSTTEDGAAVLLTYIHPGWTASIPGANWIWATNPVEFPTNDADLTKTFTKTFNIVGTPTGGTLKIAADNNYTVKVNGNVVPVVFDQNNFQLGTQDSYDVSAFLVSGSNTLEVKVTNQEIGQDADPANNPAGLLFELSFTNDECNNPPPPPACAAADTGSPSGVRLESSEGYVLGSVSGQQGWSNAVNPAYDQAIVNNTYGYSSFEGQTLRISDAVGSGSFGDWIFTPSVANEAGETGAINDGFSGGTRQNHFEAQFDIASAVPCAEQTGLHMSVSPDRGDGARMSYLRFEDQSDGIHVFFDDYTTGPNFNETDIATLQRNIPHKIKFVMDFVDGADNDVVTIYIDGALEATGTSWEEYFADNQPAVYPPTVDSLLFQARNTSNPGNIGNGFLVDNLTLTTPTPTPPGGGGNSHNCSNSQDDDQDGKIDAADPGCHSDNDPNNPGTYDPNDDSETDNSITNNDDNNSDGGSSGSVAKIRGLVAGAETSCGIYVDKFLRKGYKTNDADAVGKIQQFLNEFMGANIPVNGVYGEATEAGVKAFQLAHKDKILDPWHILVPTGIFYLTTQTEVNNIMCPALGLPIPTNLIPFSKNPLAPKH